MRQEAPQAPERHVSSNTNIRRCPGGISSVRASGRLRSSGSLDGGLALFDEGAGALAEILGARSRDDGAGFQFHLTFQFPTSPKNIPTSLSSFAIVINPETPNTAATTQKNPI